MANYVEVIRDKQEFTLYEFYELVEKALVQLPEDKREFAKIYFDFSRDGDFDINLYYPESS